MHDAAEAGGATDDGAPFRARLRELTQRLVSQAKEPFELGAHSAPAPDIARLALRHAIRLALAEGAPADAAARTALAGRVESDIAPQLAADAGALDRALDKAVGAVLAGSGLERRWREEAAWQEAWEATERRPPVLPRGARWLVQLWPIAAGIAGGLAVGVVAALVYYTLIAPPVLH